MGIESANYMIFPGAECHGIDKILRHAKMSPEVVQDSQAKGFHKWVVRGKRYWIDLMTGSFGPARREALSVRIALCNPRDADEALRKVLEELITRLHGTLRDSQTKRTYVTLDEQAWADIEAALTEKRFQFLQLFGPFEAPISGDEVFAEIRRRSETEER